MEINLSFPRPHPGQRQVLDHPARFVILNAGRRWGKDVLLQRRAAKKAARGARVGFFAPSYRMLGENWRALSHLLYPVTARKNEQDKRIDTISGGVLEFWSLDNPDAPRGRKYAHVAINEAATVKELEEAWTMVIRPTLADVRGSADFGSTPRGLNYFYTLWSQAADNPEWARFHFTTYDNPHIPKEEIDSIVATLPERVVKQEILAEFISDGSFFQNVDAAAIIDRPDEAAQHAGHYLVAGLDWALSQDFTVLVISCRECNRVVYWDRFNQIDYTYQRGRVEAACRAWSVSALLPERNSIGQPNIELLIASGLPVTRGPDGAPGFNTTATTKPELIQALAAALEHHSFKVPRAAADELRSYEVETMASGHPKFGAPDGMHDDFVMALALAWRALSNVHWLIT